MSQLNADEDLVIPDTPVIGSHADDNSSGDDSDEPLVSHHHHHNRSPDSAPPMNQETASLLSESKELDEFPHLAFMGTGDVLCKKQCGNLKVGDKASAGQWINNSILFPLKPSTWHANTARSKLICTAFHGPPLNKRCVVRFLNKNPDDCSAANLRWSVPRQVAEAASSATEKPKKKKQKRKAEEEVVVPDPDATESDAESVPKQRKPKKHKSTVVWMWSKVPTVYVRCFDSAESAYAVAAQDPARPTQEEFVENLRLIKDHPLLSLYGFHFSSAKHFQEQFTMPFISAAPAAAAAAAAVTRS